MRKSLICLVAITMIWFSSCERKDEVVPQQINCNAFITALIENDFQKVKTETTKFLGSDNSRVKQQEYLSKLIDEINKCSGLKVVDSCFGCIETNPVTSEIRLQLVYNNQVLVKSLDFRYTDNAFVVVGMHD